MNSLSNGNNASSFREMYCMACLRFRQPLTWRPHGTRVGMVTSFSTNMLSLQDGNACAQYAHRLSERICIFVPAGQYVCSITHKHHPNLINLIVRAGHAGAGRFQGQGPKRLVSETLFSYRQGARGINQRNARVLSDSVGNFCFQGSSAILRLIWLIRLCIFFMPGLLRLIRSSPGD